MAVATSTAIMGGAALLGSGLQIAQGMEQTSDGNKALNEFERQELVNVYENMPISLIGSNLRREDASQTAANLTEAARDSGIRGVFGALPRIQSMNNQANRQNQLDLDNQVMKRNYAIADDNVRIQGIQENRDNADLAGIGQQIATGQQNTMAGIKGAFNSIGMIGSGVAGNIGGGGGGDSFNPGPAQVVSNLNSMPMSFNQSPVPTAGVPVLAPAQSFSNNNALSDYYKQMEERRLYDQAAPKQFI